MVAVEICRERTGMLNMDYTRPLQATGTGGFSGVRSFGMQLRMTARCWRFQLCC
jgi:hypothetical protein